MAISELKKKGIEVSIFHVADECMKNGWSPKTTINKLIADFEDDIDGNEIDVAAITEFCQSGYEKRREIIFNYLFKSTNEATQFFKSQILNQ